MAILQPLQAASEPMEKIYICEICDTQTPASQTYSIGLVYRMAGPGVEAFQCPALQHYACSPEHAEQAMLACLEEHIKPLHQTALVKAGRA